MTEPLNSVANERAKCRYFQRIHIYAPLGWRFTFVSTYNFGGPVWAKQREILREIVPCRLSGTEPVSPQRTVSE
jgi:hypothetical protein